MMEGHRVNIVAVLSTRDMPLSATTKDCVNPPVKAEWLQIRADLVGDISVAWLRTCFRGKLLYTLRGAQSCGAFEGVASERRERLIAAARDYDLVELEEGSDLTDELLKAIPPAKRMISWRGPTRSAAELLSIFERIAIPARFYSIITNAKSPCDGLQPLLLLKTLGRKDVCAFAEGPFGLWSRLLSPYLGSPLVFGHLSDRDRFAGELSVQQLTTDYGFPVLRPIRKLFGMVGSKIFQSPSPRLHNAAYQALGYPALFLPFYVECFQEFWRDLVEPRSFDALGLSLHGFVMVSPHKEAALAVAAEASPIARKAGATNVMVHRKGIWEAHTTDPDSISNIPQDRAVKAAVIGCGGAGRAVAAALQQSGAAVTLVNRGRERAVYASNLLGLPFTLLSEFCGGDYDLLVNATPIGKENDCVPFAVDSISRHAVVVDLAYGARPTPLISAVLARGGRAIDGYDVLLTQVRQQFYLLVGTKMPAVIGRDTVVNGGRNPFQSGDSHFLSETIHSLEAC